MKTNFPLLFAALMLASGPLVAGETPHDRTAHDSHDTHSVPPGNASIAGPAAPAVLWQADEPLMRGMRRVRTATQALSQGAHGQLGAAQVTAIAQELQAAVQGMFAQCRLAPEPDAALHPLLASVLQASTRLAQGGFDPQALSELEAVVARYPLLFEDPAWSSPSDASDASTSMPRAASHPRSNNVSS